MTILTDNKVRICNDSAIYKLIVVGVLINQTETILRRKERSIWTADYRVHHVDCNSSIRYPFNDFLILVQYFIAYAQYVIATTIGSPCRIVIAVS